MFLNLWAKKTKMEGTSITAVCGWFCRCLQVPNVAVIVTDGRPQDRVAEVAAEAREKGIEIYAVGVARADMTSLRAMASPPFEDHVFLVESFDLIHQFGIQFQDKLCGKTAGQDIQNLKVYKQLLHLVLFIFIIISNTCAILCSLFRFCIYLLPLIYHTVFVFQYKISLYLRRMTIMRLFQKKIQLLISKKITFALSWTQLR